MKKCGKTSTGYEEGSDSKQSTNGGRREQETEDTETPGQHNMMSYKDIIAET